eukprot:908370-Pleurochrysis_carterae.AAC.1
MSIRMRTRCALYPDAHALGPTSLLCRHLFATLLQDLHLVPVQHLRFHCRLLPQAMVMCAFTRPRRDCLAR